MPVCGNQLLDMGVDVIMTDGIPEEFITDVLERAKSEGVPVISGGGEVEPRDFYIASFASDDTDMGVQLANLADRDSCPTVATSSPRPSRRLERQPHQRDSTR